MEDSTFEWRPISSFCTDLECRKCLYRSTCNGVSLQHTTWTSLGGKWSDRRLFVRRKMNWLTCDQRRVIHNACAVRDRTGKGDRARVTCARTMEDS